MRVTCDVFKLRVTCLGYYRIQRFVDVRLQHPKTGQPVGGEPGEAARSAPHDVTKLDNSALAWLVSWEG